MLKLSNDDDKNDADNVDGDDGGVKKKATRPKTSVKTWHHVYAPKHKSNSWRTENKAELKNLQREEETSDSVSAKLSVPSHYTFSDLSEHLLTAVT